MIDGAIRHARHLAVLVNDHPVAIRVPEPKRNLNGTGAGGMRLPAKTLVLDLGCGAANAIRNGKEGKPSYPACGERRLAGCTP
jgi:hypothetical protein